jgi:hypothetical protein
MERMAMCGWFARRARICRPVVPLSPSMKMLGFLALGALLLRRV